MEGGSNGGNLMKVKSVKVKFLCSHVLVTGFFFPTFFVSFCNMQWSTIVKSSLGVGKLDGVSDELQD